MLEHKGRLLSAVAGEAVVLLVAAALALFVRPDSPDPNRVSTKVLTCDVSSFGAAQISFEISNMDVSEHNYEVQLVVSKGSTTLGTSLSYGNHVEPGKTATVRALVPLSGKVTEASCAAHAYPHDTDVGHRPGAKN